MEQTYQFIKKNKIWIFFILIYLFGIYTYWIIDELPFLLSLYNAAALFALDVRNDYSPDEGIKYYFTYIAAALAALYTIGTILGLLLQRTLTNLHLQQQKRKSFILVCGLGKKASYYIDSELNREDIENQNIIVIEKNPENLNIEKYRAQGVAVKIGDASDDAILNDLNIINAEHIVALTGKDTTNLEIALTVKEILEEKSKGNSKRLKNFYMHIEDQNLNIFYRDGGILNDTSGLLITMFSMSKNSAQSLFLKHDIDGGTRQYIDSDKSFSIVVVGNTNLGLEIIGQACEIAHFPNENKLTIYCLDEDIDKFKMLIKHKYNNINKIPNIELVYKKLNYQSIEFYENKLWKDNITNVILCNNEAQINLDVAAQLADTTYFSDINNSSNSIDTKIHIAIYENEKIADNIQNNQEDFEYFNVFAQTSKMSSYQEIINEPFEIMAKCIHSSYISEAKYNPLKIYDKHKIDKEWIDIERLSDRDSSRAQAYHIPVKLKAMGLIQKENPSGISLEHNKGIFSYQHDLLNINYQLENELTKLGINDTALQESTKEYTGDDRDSKIKQFHKVFFPTDFKLLFEKLLRAEHNRWNAHHLLKGWKKSKKKDKTRKMHDCLVPLSELNENKKFTILYDIYSILYIPNFLTKIEHELKIPLKIGVTGHRELVNTSKIINLLRIELEKISQVYDFQEIISPLAEGADTLVVKYLLDNHNDINLIVPMPIEEKIYLQKFLTEKGKEKFQELKKKACSVYSVGKKVDKNIYMAMGKEVVNKSDLLLVLWDGKPSKGLGGTADIVTYAKECNIPILYINTDTLKVLRMNFREGK